MHKLTRSLLVVSIGLAFSAGALAQGMSQDQYKAGKDRIAADYKSAAAACDSLSGNAKDICKAEAGGNDKVAKAQLDHTFRPSADLNYKLNLAKADAGFAVAKERCDDKSGNVKDVCMKEAKAVLATAKADAKAQLKTTSANAEAARTSAAANSEASDKGATARKDAAATKRDADYTVAKEKCDAFAGEAKSSCLDDAKARFGRS
jgi:hypothetical protein